MINDLQNRARQMIRSAQHRRVQPILATHALRAQPEDTGDVARTRVAESAQLLQMMPEEVIEAFDAYNDMIRELANQRNIPLADVRAIVGAESENWGDATHFRLKGSELAAKEFFSVLSPLLEKR